MPHLKVVDMHNAGNAPTDAPLSRLRHAYTNRLEAALQAKREGKMVVGYLGNTVPTELILAAGCFPLMLSGAPEEATTLADQFLDDDFDGDLRSVYQRIVSGYFNFVDLIVIPRSSNGLLHLYYFLLETRRFLPQQVFPEVVLFDVLNTPYPSTGDYVTQRVVALKSTLEQNFACRISDDQCRAAIALVNQNRRALQDLNALRRQTVSALSGADFLIAVGAAQYMDRADHIELAHELVVQAVHMPSLSGMRLMVKGAPHDNAAFYTLVESQGARIVADDHLTGESTIEHLVDESIDPLTAIARHYHLHAPSIRSFPQSEQDQRFIETVMAAKVEGVIFFHDEFDDTLGWDYPAQKKMLDERGIASVFLQQQSYRAPDLTAQSAAIRDLLARSLS